MLPDLRKLVASAGKPAQNHLTSSPQWWCRLLLHRAEGWSECPVKFQGDPPAPDTASTVTLAHLMEASTGYVPPF